MKKLPRSFYQREDVVGIARALIGKRIVTNFSNTRTAGIITETEAYAGVTDRASHAYKGRRTRRTEVMYMDGGTAYVYLCYGIHSLFNVVTNTKDVPHAVLIRSIKPNNGIEAIQERRGAAEIIPQTTCGPGNVSRALGITTAHTATSLTGRSIWIEDAHHPAKVVAAKRIGIDYAGPDASKPWRFLMANSPWVTHPI